MCVLKKVILIFVVSNFFSYLFAQDGGYRLEIGPMGGISSYMGEANKAFYSNAAPTYGGLIRYRFDTRFAARAEYNHTKAIGKNSGAKFENPVHVMDVAGEFNFFDLEKSKYSRFSKTFTPYIFIGIGGMLYDYEGGMSFGMSFPFGLGFKFMLVNRVNLNIQLSNRLLFKDNLEGISLYSNPYGLNGSNFLNNDFLSSLTIGITLDLWSRKCDCIRF